MRTSAEPLGRGVAIVGLGHVAPHHIKAIAATEGLELRIACDLCPEKSGILPPGVPFTTELDDVLSDPSVSLVIVAVPPSEHLVVGRAVLRADRDLALEKPLAPDRQSLTALIAEVEAATEAGRGPRLFPLLHAAYGLETLWLARARTDERNPLARLGPVHGFASHFYDPYIDADGCHATGLCGSWIDSAINALSVLDRFLDVASFRVEQAAMTRLDQIAADQIQGSATYGFRATDGTPGRGLIDTNWCLRLDKKVTRLFFQSGRVEIRLDHSQETVERFDHGSGPVRLDDLNSGAPRLTSHYCGVLADLADFAASRTSERADLERAWPPHEAVFGALEMAPGQR